MTSQLINAAAFIAAIATVTFDRLILPSLDITYRYVMQELGQQPQLATAVAAMPVAVVPEPAVVKPEAKPAPQRRVTRRKSTAPKATPGVGF